MTPAAGSKLMTRGRCTLAAPLSGEIRRSPNATRYAPTIAMPPVRGIGTACSFRLAIGWSITPCQRDHRLTRGVRTKHAINEVTAKNSMEYTGPPFGAYSVLQRVGGGVTDREAST